MSSLTTPSPILPIRPNKEVRAVRRSLFPPASKFHAEAESCPPAPKPRVCHPITPSLLPEVLNAKENAALSMVFLPSIPDDMEKGSVLKRHRPRRPLVPTLRDLEQQDEHNKKARLGPSNIKLNRRPRGSSGQQLPPQFALL